MKIRVIRATFMGEVKVGVKSLKVRDLKQQKGGERLFQMQKIA